MRESHRRQGLDPLPGRIPPLPGGRGTDSPPPPPRRERRDASAPPAASDAPPSSARTGRATYRSVESQLDADSRRFLDLTAFEIKLRTDTPFDRSALLRGILRAVLESEIDFAGECDNEQEVADLLRQHLPRREA